MRYPDILMDHFLNPRHAAPLSAPATGSGTARYPTCGDIIVITLRVEGDRVVAARFQAAGCGTGIACASAMLEGVVGRTLAEADAMTPQQIAQAIELPKPKLHSAELAVQALRAAVADHRRRAAEGGGEAS